jgi:hypothetical protein
MYIMIFLNAKYAFAVLAVLFSSSAYIYDTTGKTENYWMIFSTITLGCFFGTVFFLGTTYFGNKIFGKHLNITND